MKKLKIVLVVIVILFVVAFLFMKFFPKFFWAQHAKDTEKLQAKLKKGMNDLEYAYGQDEKTPVMMQEFQIDAERKYAVYYPKELNDNSEQYPAVVFANGTGNTYINYEAGLKSLASYGLIVIGCNDSNMGSGQTLYEMGLFAKQINQDKNSIFLGRIQEDKIGVAGHSQGACGAVNAATNYPQSHELFKSLYTTSMPKLAMCKDDDKYQFAYWAYDVSKITVPYFATSGTRFLDSIWISPLSSMKENFSKLGDIPAVSARQKKANHNIVNEFHGSGYFNAWFCYTLKDDKKAAEMFDEIGHNKRWKDVMKKGETSWKQ